MKNLLLGVCSADLALTVGCVQDFDYVDNEAYEFGGQSLGAALQSRFNVGSSLQLLSYAQLYGILLGLMAVDASQNLSDMITIVDRVGLENAACECFESVAGEYRRLFGEHPRDLPLLPTAA